jgi:crotonobetainyl-CoA:carnitine CoA-transferase CaiB-like acyl-CoA transferase
MSDMGAEIIKIEKPIIGDEARFFPPYKDGQSASFATLNHGKRGAVMEMTELADDPRFDNQMARNNNEAELKKIIEGWSLQHTTAEIVEILRGSGAPISPVNDIKEVVEHPNTRVRLMIVELPLDGGGSIFCRCLHRLPFNGVL